MYLFSLIIYLLFLIIYYKNNALLYKLSYFGYSKKLITQIKFFTLVVTHK